MLFKFTLSVVLASAQTCNISSKWTIPPGQASHPQPQVSPSVSFLVVPQVQDKVEDVHHGSLLFGKALSRFGQRVQVKGGREVGSHYLWKIFSNGQGRPPGKLWSSFHLQVMQVVKEQVMRALTTKPSSLDQFKCKLQNLSYTEILKIRQSERMNQEDFQSRPIL